MTRRVSRNTRMSHSLCLLVKRFCFACQEEFGLKKRCVIDKNVNSSKKHQAAKLRLKDKQQRETDIAQAFHQEYNEGESILLCYGPCCNASQRS